MQSLAKSFNSLSENHFETDSEHGFHSSQQNSCGDTVSEEETINQEIGRVSVLASTEPSLTIRQEMRRARLRQCLSSIRLWMVLMCVAATIIFIMLNRKGCTEHNKRQESAWFFDSSFRSSSSSQARLSWWWPTRSGSPVSQFRPTANLLESGRTDDDYINSNEPKEGQISDPSDFSNPAIVGWSPKLFPNPITDPTLCHIAPEDSSVLHFCDPDGVVTSVWQPVVAEVLRNFSASGTSSPTLQAPMQDGDIGDSTTGSERGSSQFQRSPSSLNKPHGLNTYHLDRPVGIGVAIVERMDLPAVLRQGPYYSYEDEDDMINDAAQVFARHLHDTWWTDPTLEEFGIILFTSVRDQVCFISTGSALTAVLPWWRLDHVVSRMKPRLRDLSYGAALVQALQDIHALLEVGPPTLWDRLSDFFTRFGVVIVFAVGTFGFGAWGEYRDRFRRLQFVEERSQLKSDVERQKARQLQQEIRTTDCPICLEPFPKQQPKKKGLLIPLAAETRPLTSADSDTVAYEIPEYGADGKKVKLLRCGHIFCDGCWKAWVHSGCNNPCNCPMCRQDIGATPRSKQSSRSRLRTGHRAPTMDSTSAAEATYATTAQYPTGSSESLDSSTTDTTITAPSNLTTYGSLAVRGTALVTIRSARDQRRRSR